ncbi:hypothetical protein Tco_0050338, partial [Tanacetum coccineum]
VIDAEEIRLLLKEQATTQQQQANALHSQVAALGSSDSITSGWRIIWDHRFHVQCGLTPSLQRKLLVAKPTSLGDAFSLARVAKARLEDQGVTPPTNRSVVASGSQT